jgi:hypothetical protein
MKKYSIGYTAHNLENENNVREFLSFFNAGIVPDFVVFHQKYYKRVIVDILNKLRGKKQSPELLTALAKVKIYNIPDINSAEAKAVFDKYNHALVICNSGLVKKKTLAHPTTVFINKHASKLPLYRGVHNIQWALWYGTPVYLTVLRIMHGIDEGDIIWQQQGTVSVKDFTSFDKYKWACQYELFGKIGVGVKHYIEGDGAMTPQEGVGDKLLQYYSMHPFFFRKLLKDNNLQP